MRACTIPKQQSRNSAQQFNNASGALATRNSGVRHCNEDWTGTSRHVARSELRAGILTADEAAEDLKHLADEQMQLEKERDEVAGELDASTFEEARLTATTNMFAAISMEWRRAMRESDGETVRRILRQLVREISATPIAKGCERRRARTQLEIVFNFDVTERLLRPPASYAS